MRDREKQRGDGRGTGFLNWLREQEISKTQAYSLIELANSADALLEGGVLNPEDVNHFSKRAFIETAQAAPEVQQLVSDRLREAEEGEGEARITQREVKRLGDEWTAMTSELLPIEIREKAADNTIPARYLTPARPRTRKAARRASNLSAARSGSDSRRRHREASHRRSALFGKISGGGGAGASYQHRSAGRRNGVRRGAANRLSQQHRRTSQSGSPARQTVAKLYTTWRRVNSLAERVYLDSGASTPQLRSLLDHLNPLTQSTLQVTIGEVGNNARTIQLSIATDEE